MGAQGDIKFVRMQESNNTEELLIRVDRLDVIQGSIKKYQAHLLDTIQQGIVHRAFSLFLFDEANRLLVQQRSKYKCAWPLHYSNSCCSHPLYMEYEMEDNDHLGIKRAARRRLKQELGIPESMINLDNIKLVDKFFYTAISNETYGESELDYILLLRKNVNTTVNEQEIKKICCVSKSNMDAFLATHQVTPWFKMIIDRYPIWEMLDA